MQSQMRKMRCLIVGGGSIGKRHINNLKILEVSEIYVLKQKMDEDFEREYGVVVVDSYSTVDQIELDCVFVCTPTSLHVEALLYASKRNIHVFMEKPLIHNQQELSKVQQLSPDFDGVFFIGFMLRFHPLVMKIKDLLNQKVIGDWYNARFEFGSWLPYWHPWEDHRVSYASRKDLGGGVINTITHELDLMYYLLGSPIEVKTVKQNLNKLAIEVEEQVEAIFQYSHGLATIHLDYLQKDYDRQVKILGDDGKILWDWHSNEVVVKKHNEEEKRFEIDKSYDVNQLYIDELKKFFSLISTNQTKHELDLDYAIENTKWMIQMHKSADV